MSLLHDLRYGARTLRKSPGFTVTAIATLALGIGVTTATYSLADAMLWKPIPVPHLETLVAVNEANPNSPEGWRGAAPADIADIRSQSSTLASLASWQQGLANIAGSGVEPERVPQALVSANFFDVVGVQPALGRAFVEGEDQPGRERVAILSNGFWRRSFGGDPHIAGKTIRLDDQNYVVAGVMPARYAFPMAVEVWTPMALTPEARNSRRDHSLTSVARLKPGRTVKEAAAEITGFATRLEQQYPNTNKDKRFAVLPAYRLIVDRETNQYLILLLGAVLFVLLIACSNVANLQFARATGRLREMAVRTALGASRRRVVAQLITESVLLAMAGAGLGLLVAAWGIDLIRAAMPPEIGRYVSGFYEIQLDLRTLTFTLLAAVASGILAGLAPALQCSRPNLTDALKEGGRGSSTGQARRQLRNILVAGEVALAVMLLVGAGLMVRGFGILMSKGGSFEPSSQLTFQLALTDNKYPEAHSRLSFYRDVLSRIDRLPGVHSTAAATAMPFSYNDRWREFFIEGRPPMDPKDQPFAMYQLVTAKYFDNLRIKLLAGRLLAESDGPDAPRVAVISQQMARQYWKTESPIGQHIRIDAPGSEGPWLKIAGVVEDVMYNTGDTQPRLVIYAPYQQSPSLWMEIGVRTAGDPLRIAPAITAAVHDVDPEQPIMEMMTLEKVIHNRLLGLNYVRVMMAIFGALALVLAAVGVYGVMAYLVSEQTHDIGIRLALGAPRETVLKGVFRRGLATTAAGLALGLVGAYFLAQGLRTLIFAVSPTDAVTFIGIPLALLAVAALAIFIPARRAMQVDPIVALRYE